MRSTSAAGKVFSCPKIMPIFFVLTEDSCCEAKSELEKEFYRHLLPPGPVVPSIISPDIQPVRDRLGIHDARKPYVLVLANVPFPCGQDDVHSTVAAQIPVIREVGQKIWGTIEITVGIVVAVQELMNVERAAHAHAIIHQIGMLEGEIHGVIAAETTSRQSQLG